MTNNTTLEFKPLNSYSIRKLVDELIKRKDFDAEDYFDFDFEDRKKIRRFHRK